MLIGVDVGMPNLMIAKLSRELTEALKASGDGQLEIVDPETQQTHYLVNSDMHRRAMEALRRQQYLDAIEADQFTDPASD